MENRRNNNKKESYAFGIKNEPNDYSQKSMNENNDSWNEGPNSNNGQHKNNRGMKPNNNSNNKNYIRNNFLGIKREISNDTDDNYSPPTRPKFKRENSFNNNNYDNNSYNKNIKRESDDNYSNTTSNNSFDNNRNNNNYRNYNNRYQQNNNRNQMNKKNNFNQNNNNNFYYKNRNQIKNDNNISNNNNSNNSYNNNNNNNNNMNLNNNFNRMKQSVGNELPIYSVKNDILSAIARNRVTIISGNTGCGKSTQVPQYIYGYNCNNLILMTQPRRIAAVSIAKRLADEMHERLGGKIGYHVSMNPNFGLETKIFVKTTGIFMEELIHKNLDYTHIIIDEVHERDIYVDLVLALIKWYFEHNPQSKIKVILMSATIAEGSFAEYLKDINGGQVPVIKIKENIHTVYQFNLNDIFNNIKYDKCVSDEIKKEIENVTTICFSQIKNVPVFMDELFPVVAAIIEKIEHENPHCNNGVLIFVPGLAEIQELQDYLSRYFLNKNKLEFLILHSQISDDEQDKVFKYGKDKRKIILATNIAESSITISNIDFVIDFCLVKQTRFDEYQNTSVLELKWCSKASCQQRKGRTGRVNRGFYFQLITQLLREYLSD